jgi:TonB family protein
MTMPAAPGTSRRRRPDGRALAASLAVHGVLLLVMVVAGRVAASPLPEFRVYRVHMVSPPPLETGPPEPAVAEAPPVETAPVEAPPPAPEPDPVRPEPAPPRPEPQPQVPPRTPPADRPAPQPPRREEPQPQARRGGEGINVQIEGEEFPFPDYLANITLQVRRYFRWSGRADLAAEVYFVIERDGSVSDMRVLRPSGDVSFDFAALSAIEVAGNAGAFGALPAGFRSSRLPISFFFEPPR